MHRTGSSVGGYGVVLFHDGSSDWTFYTHFQSPSPLGEGAHVSAGSTIGYVGNTGTTVYHLHFEYHPGGGASDQPLHRTARRLLSARGERRPAAVGCAA